MTRQRSRGSILSFVIVAVLLLGLIAGAVYAVRRGIFNGATKPAEVARETTATTSRRRGRQVTQITASQQPMVKRKTLSFQKR